MPFGGFSASKLKPQLKMAVHRFSIASNKKSALSKQQKREIAVMLSEGKEEKARIKAEALIREDNTIEAYEIMQLECELLAERIKLLSTQKECPPDLVSCVSTLMWASSRVDNIPELAEIRRQFKSKYGKKFDEAAMNNAGGVINERVMAKLSVQPPSAYLCQTYLEKICEEYEVDWEPKVPVGKDDMEGGGAYGAPTGYSVPVAQGSGLGTAVVTGTDVNSYYNKGNGNDDGSSSGGGGGTATVASAAFPAAPGAYPVSGASASQYPRGKPDPNDPPSAPSGPPPLAYAEPYESLRSLQPVAPPANNDDDDEPDIYVPGSSSGAKKQLPKGSGSSVASSITAGTTSHRDEPRDDGESNGNDASYDSLTARFNRLKR